MYSNPMFNFLKCMPIVLFSVGCMLSVGFKYTCHIFNYQCDDCGKTQGLIIQ